MKMLQNVDILGVESKIYVYGEERYKTTFGAVMSILSILSLLGLIIYFIDSFYNKVGMSVIYNRGQNRNLTVELSNIPFLFRLSSTGSQVITDNYAKTILQYWVVIGNNQVIMTNVTLEACDINKHFGDFQYLYQNLTISNYMCLPADNNVNLFETGSDKGYLNAYIVTCTNNSAYFNNRTDCATPSAIQTRLSGAFGLDVSFPDYKIDHMNYTNPVTPYVYFTRIQISLDFYYTALRNLQGTSYSTDIGSVFTDFQTATYYQVPSGTESITVKKAGTKVGVPNAIGAYQLEIAPFDYETYIRSYPKLQSVIANIGGVVKFILAFSSEIVRYVSNIFYMIDFMVYFGKPKTKSSKNLLSKDFKPDVQQYNNNNSMTKILKTNNFVQEELKTAPDKGECTKTSILKKSKKIDYTFRKALFEKIFFCRKGSKKITFNDYEKSICRKLSTNNILKALAELEKLKNVLFDDEQRILFENIRNLSIEEEKLIKYKIRNSTNEQLEEFWNSTMANSDEIAKKIVKLVKKME